MAACSGLLPFCGGVGLSPGFVQRHDAGSGIGEAVAPGHLGDGSLLRLERLETLKQQRFRFVITLLRGERGP